MCCRVAPALIDRPCESLDFARVTLPSLPLGLPVCWPRSDSIAPWIRTQTSAPKLKSLALFQVGGGGLAGKGCWPHLVEGPWVVRALWWGDLCAGPARPGGCRRDTVQGVQDGARSFLHRCWAPPPPRASPSHLLFIQLPSFGFSKAVLVFLMSLFS